MRARGIVAFGWKKSYRMDCVRMWGLAVGGPPSSSLRGARNPIRFPMRHRKTWEYGEVWK